ncbi:serine/threonine-protein kinase ICK [Pleurodeles waltl]|uniref:serine/threonine-protein kinase ICK n=1 Tax=Pleurodeles waltl TaxID=8319 RepID=UPI00370977EF
MNRYTTIKQLGDGTYGSVLLGRSVDSGELVAIKKMKRKFYSWEECMNLREVKSLQKLNHANVVKLKEVIRENDNLYFVFEYMKENLYQLMKDRSKLFPESAIRNIMYQILQGLAYIHKYGFFHRDLKPENLLCMGPELVKIADFGLARETRSRPPYTDYVSTRWYRAPEVLLRSTNYNSPIDIWAVGCIMAEVYTLRPLFPGSSEIDTIFKICQVLGTPKKNDWTEGYLLAGAMNFRWPQCVPSNLKTLIPNASSEAVQLLRDMLQWDPRKRPTASQALRYPYFHVGQALGAPQHIKELVDQQKVLQEKQVPFLIKPVPPAHPPSKPGAHLLSRTFKQSQPQQSLTYPFKNESSFGDHLHHLREKDKTHQLQLPALITKVPHQKIQPATENANGEVKQKNRKRWGHITRAMKGSSDWDDLEDIDFGSSATKTDLKTENKKQSSDALSGFESVLDLKSTDKTSSSNAAPPYTSFPLQHTTASQTTSDKQHYLKHSRYLPGLCVKTSIVSNPSKDFTSDPLWPNPNQPVKPFEIEGGANKRNSGPSGHNRLTSGCIPQFYKREFGYTGQRAELGSITDSSNCTSMKSTRPYIGHTSFNPPSKNTRGLISKPPPIQPVNGRIDWMSKYGGHR